MDFKALETEGGKIAAILFMLVFLTVLAAVLHLTHHDPQEAGREALTGAFASLMTLLLNKLGSKQP